MSPERHELVVLPDGEVVVPDLAGGLTGLVRHLDGSRPEPVAGLLGAPRLARTRAFQLPLREPPAAMRTDLLWRWHARGAAMYRGASGHSQRHRSDESYGTDSPGAVTWVEVKLELARRLLGPVCGLCARRCRVDRRAGEVGLCGLGPALRLAAPMRLWGEEPELGRPGLALPAIGCGLRCRFCYRAEHLDPGAGAAADPDAVAAAIDAADGVAHVHWLGGSPDESLPAILDVLGRVKVARPVVWNTHSYLTAEQVTLLEGVVDGFVADLKFGPGPCAERIAGVNGYWAAATAALRRMVGSGALVIVRHVALPGHLGCCAEPVLRWLADELPAAQVRVLTQYEPFGAARGDGLLGRRLNDAERRWLERRERER